LRAVSIRCRRTAEAEYFVSSLEPRDLVAGLGDGADNVNGEWGGVGVVNEESSPAGIGVVGVKAGDGDFD